MNIVIPMGGVARYKDEAYRFPKPLVNIIGRPMLFWLLDNLDVTSEDIIWIALPEGLEHTFALIDRLRAEYSSFKFRKISLSFETRGAAETLYSVLQHMSADELKRKTISLDCDTLYFSNVLNQFRSLPADRSCTFYAQDDGNQPSVYSYIALDPDDPTRVLDIAEKIQISSLANTGAYGFSSGEILRKFIARSLDEAVGQVGEYFVSSVIKRMILEGEVFEAVLVEKFSCLGTPWQLEAFLAEAKAGRVPSKRKMRFCFDLDNTLVSYPTVHGDYSSVEAKSKNIQLVQELKAAGHYIIIQTARRMKTHNANVGAALRDIGLVTFETLSRFEIPYDEIHFGKPYADVYVDDLSVNALVDTEKEIGWVLSATDSHVHVPGFVKPRHFNTVQLIDDVVIKSASISTIKGEVYFYEHIPQDLLDVFPKLLRVDRNDQLQIYSLSLARVRGTTMAHLCIDRCVTAGRLTRYLNTLRCIHSSPGDVAHALPRSDVNIYANYAVKLENRYRDFKPIYDALGADVGGVFDTILALLRDYERADRGLYASVIHGDPVFSNVLFTPENKPKFLDMRGLLGSTLTLQGDAMYDLAKAYQCLCGYDFILLDRPFTEQDREYLADLKLLFRRFVAEHYPTVQFEDIELVTASLLISLIPLHDNFDHQKLFFSLCKSLTQRLAQGQQNKGDSRSSNLSEQKTD
eukprot:TRINITY_DN6811_c0_g1_i2.p1 TRINITY_DN6811_c0_g1~~TRINITY_DN6811_c0_g1_i2.p1  ORF type:complete len:691 (-),score=232.11 TRINITY_DN6811_c0_g1_i2:164-2236(-)